MYIGVAYKVMKIGKYIVVPNTIQLLACYFSLDFNLLFKANNNLSCFNTLSYIKPFKPPDFLGLSTVMYTSGISKHLLSWIEEESS